MSESEVNTTDAGPVFQGIERELQSPDSKNSSEAARMYLSRGIPIWPIRLSEHGLMQRPGTSMRVQSHIIRSISPRAIRTLLEFPDIAIPCSEQSGICVLDVDNKSVDGTASLLGFMDAPDFETAFPGSPIAVSRGGKGRHIFFRHPPGLERIIGFLPGVDLLAGAQVCIVAPAGLCRWIRGGSLLDLPDKVMQLARRSAGPGPKSNKGPGRGNENVTEDDLLSAHPIRKAFNEQNPPGKWLEQAGYVLRRTSAAGDVSEWWSRPGKSARDLDVRVMQTGQIVYCWADNDPLSCARGDPGFDSFATWAMLVHNVDIRSGKNREAAIRLRDSLTEVDLPGIPLRDRLDLTDKGAVQITTRNLRKIVGSSEFEDYIGRLEYDQFAQDVLLNGAPVPNISILCADIQEWVNTFGPQWKPESAIRSTIREYTAKTRGVDPLRNYFTELPPPDGTDYLGIMVGLMNVDDLSKRVIASALCSAVARACDPGCKVDTMMILTGPQGTGKSTWVSRLPPSLSWFSDEIGPGIVGYSNETRDEQMKLRGRWVLEMAELKAFRSNRAVVWDKLKGFLSQRFDTYRVPYSADIDQYPRRSVFIGTTNRDDFLGDATGSRRFPVVPVPTPIFGAVDYLTKYRDAIWAQLFSRWKANPLCHVLGADETADVAHRNRSFEERDEIVEDHGSWQLFRQYGHIRVSDVAFALGMDAAKSTTGDTQRIRAVLNARGWESLGVCSVSGKVGRWWKNPDQSAVKYPTYAHNDHEDF